MKMMSPIALVNRLCLRRRLIIAVAALVIVNAQSNRWAFFDSVSKIPNPQSGDWLGDASYWDSGAWGWTMARYDGPGSIFGSWISKGYNFVEEQWDTTESGASSFTYKIAENYWDGYTYNNAWSEVEGSVSGFAQGTVWDNTP